MLSYVSSISSVLASLYLGAHLGAHDALEAANLLVAARVSEQLANANTSHLMYVRSDLRTLLLLLLAGEGLRAVRPRSVASKPPLILLFRWVAMELNRIMFEQKTRDDRSGRMVL